MSKALQPVRGTKDLYLEDAEKFQAIVALAQRVAELYNFQPFATPIFEFTEVFKRTLGETSDVVNKEMYTFEDRGGESLTLRPEFTAGIVRALISNGLQQHLPMKCFSHGPLFRYERPQKGRQRQFHQVNFEWFGDASPEADVELIILASHLLHDLGILPQVKLLVNTLGDAESRVQYRKALVEYFQKHKSNLSEDSLNRLEKNPLRILDSKDEGDRKLIANAPQIQDYLTMEATAFFQKVLDGIRGTNVSVDMLGISPHFLIEHEHSQLLVRGLDYYTHTVFEFVAHSDALGAQNTVLAGGRYDELVEQMGGPSIPAVGFAAGIERLALMQQGATHSRQTIALIMLDGSVVEGIDAGILFATRLRTLGYPVEVIYTSAPGKGLKKANKCRAAHALILGSEEIKTGKANIKHLDSGIDHPLPLNGAAFDAAMNEYMQKVGL